MYISYDYICIGVYICVCLQDIYLCIYIYDQFLYIIDIYVDNI